ncbi:MAG: hypothetical protein D6743_11350 [Calditrichaeota bacterium]|nr:MAG: hypothetical protein D6743_11350 [Calditrichota bacterium]
MLRRVIVALALVFLALHTAQGDEGTQVIKVNGAYGIVNKGANQGLEVGQVLVVRRRSTEGVLEVGKVKVIRTTANRAAVEQMAGKRGFHLVKGDMLFGLSEVVPPPVLRPPERTTRSGRAARKDPANTRSKMRPISEPRPAPKPERPPTVTRSRSSRILTKPWITVNLGTIVSGGGFSGTSVPSFKFGASYMVPAGHGFNLGLEVNNVLLNTPSLNAQGLGGFNKASSSLLEAYFVAQKFFGRRFFLESGAGIYRPKVRTVSVDGVESSYTSTNFGFFAGSGVVIPTSQYAGFMLRGRLHNYFDSASRHYLGLAAGFRFKMR